RLFAGASGHSAWTLAAACHSAHLGVAGRANLYPARHRRAARRRFAARRPVPYLERARIGVWHRGRHDDGGRWSPRLHRDLEVLALAAVAGWPPPCAPPSRWGLIF